MNGVVANVTGISVRALGPNLRAGTDCARVDLFDEASRPFQDVWFSPDNGKQNQTLWANATGTGDS